MSLYGLGVAQAAEEIREGRISSAELVADCLKRNAEIDDKGKVAIDYRPVHEYTMTNDIEYIAPKARVY